MIFLLAFIGGLLLNLMPCVLPVLALKATSLHDDYRWYVAGMMSVFGVLATLSVALGLAWGEQFNYQWFSIALTGLVFAMGLSFLGVWELPQPGIRQGEVGSFGRGVLTTLLATPCSGPFLGPVFGATLGQHPATVYTIFACVGAGMSAPYLAMPLTRRLLPKPGAWMVTLRQVAGFALIGTSIWLLRSVSDRWLFPTLIALLGVGVGCWSRRKSGWVVAAAVAWAAFYTAPSDILPWQPYSAVRMTEARAEGRPVMVEFTAKWCLTCQLNEAILNTAAIKRAVERDNVACLRAEMNDETAALLRSLGYNSVPVLAIYGNKTIVLPDLISKQQVLDALEQAR
jgi:suppressor for copper-sensitivity B